jgi:uroporphyrinogen-III decarboxylase
MFLDYYEHPDDLKSLIGRLAECQRESIRKMAARGCNGVMGYDDWGLQDRLMVSTGMIEEFFMPHYHQNWKLAHDLGMDVWLHSCGYIIDILPEFIKAGLNVIQMDQQENMGLENLSKKVGGTIAFWCPVDVQKTMVDGSIEDVRNYVKQMIETLGSHNGGFISMAYSTPDAVGHTTEKIDAMCKAFREYEGLK